MIRSRKRNRILNLLLHRRVQAPPKTVPMARVTYLRTQKTSDAWGGTVSQTDPSARKLPTITGRAAILQVDSLIIPMWTTLLLDSSKDDWLIACLSYNHSVCTWNKSLLLERILGCIGIFAINFTVLNLDLLGTPTLETKLNIMTEKTEVTK